MHLEFTEIFSLFYLFDRKLVNLMFVSFLRGKISATEKSGASQRFCVTKHARSASGEQYVQVCI